MPFSRTYSTGRAAARADPSACGRDERRGENRWRRWRQGADGCGGGGGGDRRRRDDDDGDDGGGVRVPRRRPTETHRLRRRPTRRAWRWPRVARGIILYYYIRLNVARYIYIITKTRLLRCYFYSLKRYAETARHDIALHFFRKN